MVNDPVKLELHTQIHLGRRDKLRRRFMKDGLDTFNECEVLEMALGFVIPRQDTNPAAHSLINIFGSLSAVMEAKPEDLAQAYGIGDQAAVFLAFVKQLGSYLGKLKLRKARIISPYDAVQYLRPLMKTYSVEEMVVVCIDSADKVKTVTTVTNRELDSVHVNLRELIALVNTNKAAKILLAHNHLNGECSPSLPDMQLTRKLATVCQILGINFLDHFIFADEEYYSFRTSGLLDIFKEEARTRYK